MNTPETQPGGSLKPVGSVEKLRQYVSAAWIEAEAVGIDAERNGKVPEVLMVLKARDMLREVMATLSMPPNVPAQRPPGNDV
jgi:hypothetical protein